MERETILREVYLEKIRGFIDSEFIKVITGLRRSGKSEFLKMIRNEVAQKVDSGHIVYINFESAEFDNLLNYKALNDFFNDVIKDDKKYYIFLDEIQDVKEWERSVNSLRLRNTDIYITGSNSKIMSDELATKLGGRTVSFKIYPLSFREFIDFRIKNGLSGGKDLDGELEAYIRLGGFPVLSVAKFGLEDARKIVEDINSTALIRDVVQRYEIRRPQLLEKIVAFIYDNVGSLVSITSIVNYLKKEKRSGDPETIANYMKYLEDAHIVSRAQRYDIQGKKLLETLDKYYLGDHSLQYAVRSFKQDKISGILENIVYVELLRRGYKVYVGKTNAAKISGDKGNDGKAGVDKEIDFVAEKEGVGKVYVQVCKEFSAQETYDREFSPLVAIKDSYPKYVVTTDKFWQADENGVKGIHLKDFLLKQEL